LLTPKIIISFLNLQHCHGFSAFSAHIFTCVCLLFRALSSLLILELPPN
jgi:hypothetical protein